MTVHDYDAELRAYNQRLRGAIGVGAADQVLDIGCGAGQSTREAARIAAPGRVLGIDLSAPMIERARQLTAAERLDNVASWWATPRPTRSPPVTTTSPSAGSGPCSSPTRIRLSATSPVRCGHGGAWCCSCGRPVSATSGHRRRDFQSTSEALASLDRAATARALDRLRETLAAHHDDRHGVVFDSRAWIITAHRR